MSASGKQRFEQPVEEAETDQTRQRRIAKAIDMLPEGRA
ncbi:MAG TPA: YdeI/OmpD-associated family protein [Pseudonocardiaceae bacterium]